MCKECGEFQESAEVRKGFISGVMLEPVAVEYAVVDDLAVFEGDIVLGTAEELEASGAADVPQMEFDPEEVTSNREPGEMVLQGCIITGQKYRWPSGVVPYEIDSGLPDQKRVTDAIKHWEDKTPIRFVKRSNHSDYVRFIKSGGCWSYVGRQGGKQDIGLANGCSTGNTIHEIGHAVGLWHEQSREDRDKYVTVHYANIQAGKEHNFNQHITDGDDVGPYDYDSLMHYPKWAFSKNNKDTITPKKAGVTIGQRSGLSAGDIAAVQAMYGRKWGKLGGKIWDPCVGNNQDGRLEVFARGGDGALWHIWQTSPNNGWSGWHSLGGKIWDPCVGNNKDGRLEVFARGGDGALWHIWQTSPNNGWSGWHSLGGKIGRPVVANNADGRLEVFVQGADGALWHIWQTAPNNGWSGWHKLGGQIDHPIIGRNQDGRLEVFARGGNGALWHIWQTAPNNGWSGWHSLGGKVWNPCVGNNKDGRLEVFARGGDGALWHIWQTSPNNGWSGWNSLGGRIKRPVVVSNQDGRLEVFVEGLDDAVWHKWQVAPNNGWSGWGSLGGDITDHAVGNNQDGRIEVFARGTDGGLWHLWQTKPNNGWSG